MSNWKTERAGTFEIIAISKIRRYSDRDGWHANQVLTLKKNSGEVFDFKATEGGLGGDHFNCRQVGDKLSLKQGAHFVSTMPPMPPHSHVGTVIDGQYSSGGLEIAR